ncbi:MAG: methionine--tRNA ligase [Oligoflexia bacterium]|nr:methionine--tRNA ligase [Oligoflexia bacterium]
MSQTHYVTTAIVYPNSRIHVGWAWECLGADWLVRSLKLQGKDAFFATGMDEHSLNVQRAAERQGLTPKVYCDQMAEDIQRVLRQMGMSYDRFIRTSDPDHEWVVQQLVKRAFEKGDIYKARYEGHYCESCEAFYTEKDLIEGNCPQHGKPPKWITEENYFFRLSKYQEPLLKLFEEHPEFIQPDYRRAELVNFIKAGLKDFSVSRSTFTWGIPLPFEPQHVVYVWFDALINYLTAAGFEYKLKEPDGARAREFEARWAGAVHIIGKDISRFHCVYWPAMLMSLDLPLPKQVFAHGFITLKGDKMSKSTGVMVTPDEVVAVTGPDPFRYYMLAENRFSEDGNFTWEALLSKANADLANDWGNLVNRSINMARKYFPDEALAMPAPSAAGSASAAASGAAEVRASFEKLPAELADAIRRIDPGAYAAACTARSRVLNLYIDRTKPWALAKAATPESRAELQWVLYTLLEGIRWTATALLPLLPFRMPEVFRQLGIEVPAEKGALSALKWGEKTYRPLEPSPIYPRIELPKTE